MSDALHLQQEFIRRFRPWVMPEYYEDPTMRERAGMGARSNLFQSQIDPTKPTEIYAYTAHQRQNWQHAKDEIEGLYRLWEGGEFGIDDAPTDGRVYGRKDGAWVLLPDLDVIDGGTF